MEMEELSLTAQFFKELQVQRRILNAAIHLMKVSPKWDKVDTNVLLFNNVPVTQYVIHRINLTYEFRPGCNCDVILTKLINQCRALSTQFIAIYTNSEMAYITTMDMLCVLTVVQNNWRIFTSEFITINCIIDLHYFVNNPIIKLNRMMLSRSITHEVKMQLRSQFESIRSKIEYLYTRSTLKTDENGTIVVDSSLIPFNRYAILVDYALTELVTYLNKLV